MNFFKKFLFTFMVFLGMLTRVSAQCDANSEEMKNLRATQFSHFPKVTASEQGLIYLDTAKRDGYATYTATNDATNAVFTGTFNATLGEVVINVGALTQDATFTIKVEKGACSYTLPQKAVFQIATQPEIVARVRHEYCANGGGIYYQLVGGVNPADYDFVMLRFGTEVTLSADGVPATRAGEFTLKAKPKNGGDVLETQGEVLDRQKRIVYSARAVSQACVNTGSIVFDVREGSFPMRYEILTGPVTRPIQDTPVFDNLPAGTYTVRVTDFCATGGGQAAPTTVVIAPKTDFSAEYYSMWFINKISGTACLDNEFLNKLEVSISINEETYNRDNYSYPFVLKRSFISPSGQVYDFSNTINNRADLDALARNTYVIPPSRKILALKPISGVTTTEHSGEWRIVFSVESCGNTTTFFDEKRIISDKSYVDYYRPELRRECSGQSRDFIAFNVDWDSFNNDNIGMLGHTHRIVLESFPACYDPLANGFYKENGKWYQDYSTQYPEIDNICQGQFVFRVENACNISKPYTMDIGVLTPLSVDYHDPYLSGSTRRCGEKQDIYIGAGWEKNGGATQARFSKVKLVSFSGDASKLPAGISIPQEFPEVVGQTTLSLWGTRAMPYGEYVFEIEYFCDTKTYTLRETIEKPVYATANWDYAGNCVLTVSLADDGTNDNEYYIQWYNSKTNSWVYPKGAKPDNDQDAQNERYRIYKGQSIVFDDEYYKEGQYRIVARPNNFEVCYEEVSKFNLPAKQVPDITSIVGIQCIGTTYRVGIQVKGGTEPYKYFLVEEGVPGAPVLIHPEPGIPSEDDGNSNVFFDIDGSNPNKVYKFRVEDRCGGANTREIAIALLAPFEVELDSPTHCVGGTATLSVPKMSIMNYEWYDKANPTVILSTENYLELKNLTDEHFNKTYVIKVTSKSNRDICVNKTLEKTLTIDPSGALDLSGTSENLDICIAELDQEVNQTLYSNFNLKEKLFPRAIAGGVIVDKNKLIAVPDDGVIDIRALREFFKGKEVTFVYQYKNPCGLISEVEAKVWVRDIVYAHLDQITICSGVTQTKSLNHISEDIKNKYVSSEVTSVEWFSDWQLLDPIDDKTTLATPLNPTQSTHYYAKITGKKNCFASLSIYIQVNQSLQLQDETFTGCNGMTLLDLKNKILDRQKELGKTFYLSNVKIFLQQAGKETELENEKHQLTLSEEYWYQIQEGICPSAKHKINLNLSNASLVSDYTIPANFLKDPNSTTEISICETDDFSPIVFKGTGTNLEGIWEKYNNATNTWEPFTENTQEENQGGVYTYTFTPAKADIVNIQQQNYRFTLRGCNRQSSTFTLRVLKKINDKLDTADGLVCRDGSTTIYAPYHHMVLYQWYSNTTNSHIGATELTGQTDWLLNVNYDANAVGDTYYFVKMKYNTPNVTCPEVLSTIKKVVMLDQDPPTDAGRLEIPDNSQSVCLNASVTFTATHHNPDPSTRFAYQWYKYVNGTPEIIDGETGFSYTPDTSNYSDGTTMYEFRAIYCGGYISYQAYLNVPKFNGSYSFEKQAIKSCLDVTKTLYFNAWSNIVSYQWYESPDFYEADADKPNATPIANATSNRLDITSSEAKTRYYFVRITDNCGRTIDTELKKVEFIAGESVELQETLKPNVYFCENQTNATVELKPKAGAVYTYVWEKYNQTTFEYEVITGQDTHILTVDTSQQGTWAHRVNVSSICDTQVYYFNVNVGKETTPYYNHTNRNLSTCDDKFQIETFDWVVNRYNGTPFKKYEWFVADVNDVTQATKLNIAGSKNDDYSFEPDENGYISVVKNVTQPVGTRYYFLKAYQACDDNDGVLLTTYTVIRHEVVLEEMTDYKPDSCDGNLKPSVIIEEIKRRLVLKGLDPANYDISIFRKNVVPGGSWDENITNHNPEPSINPNQEYFFSIRANNGSPCDGKFIKLHFEPSKKPTKITKPLSISKNVWCLGETLQLEVEAEGENNDTLVYNWYKTDAMLSQRTFIGGGIGMNTYELTVDEVIDLSSIEVEVEGECGKDTSTINNLSFIAPKANIPKFNQNHDVCLNAPPIYLELIMPNSAGYTVQWFENTTNTNQGGTPITGATNIWLNLQNQQVGTFYYYAEVTSECGETVTSEVYIVKVSDTTEMLPAQLVSYCDVSELNSDVVSSSLANWASATYNFGAVNNSNIFEKNDPNPISGQLLDPTKEYEFEFIVNNGNCPKRVPLTFSTTTAINLQPKSVKDCYGTTVSVSAISSNPMVTYKWFRNTTNSVVNAEELPYTEAIINDSIDNITGGQNKVYVFAEITDACGTTLTTDVVSVEMVEATNTPIELTRYLRKGTESNLNMGVHAGLDYVFISSNPTIVKVLDLTPKVEAVAIGKTTILANSFSGCSVLLFNTIVWDIEAKADTYEGNSKEDNKVFDDTIIKEDLLNNVKNPSLKDLTDSTSTGVVIKVTTNTATAVTGSTTQFKLLQQDPTTNTPMATQPSLAPILEVTTGKVTLPKGTPSGTYTLKYKLGYQPDANQPEVGESNEVEVKVVVTNEVVATDNTFTKGNDDKDIEFGTASTTISVLRDDTINGEAVGNQITLTKPNPIKDNNGNDIIKMNDYGTIKVEATTPPGTYTLTYKICETGATSENCDDATVKITVKGKIDAVNNDFTSSPITSDGGTTTSVFAGDTLNGNAVNKDNVNVTLTDKAGIANVTIDAEGKITIPKDTRRGSYTLTYQICDKAGTPICDTANVTIVVKDEINAEADDFTSSSITSDGGTTASVFAGDTLNGKAVNKDNVNVTLTDKAGIANVTIDAEGKITIPKDTRRGSYTLTYQICDKAGTPICDTANVTIVVKDEINAEADDFTSSPITSDGGTTTSVFAGDTLNGNAVNKDNVSVELLNNGGITNATIDDEGKITIPKGTPRGSYTLKYKICDKKGSPICSEASVTIVVKDDIDAVDDDFTNTPIARIGGETPSVFTNDTFNGDPIDKHTVRVTLTNNGGINNATIDNNGVITIPQGTPYGTYTLTYEICDKKGTPVCNEANIIILVAAQDCELTFYNAISTNGDASNDSFVIEGIECYPENTLKIFNRWGVLVYEKQGYDQSFRGFSNGRATVERNKNDLPNGTYYYIFDYKNAEGETKRKAGWLYKSN